jgi:alpha-glucosidase
VYLDDGVSVEPNATKLVKFDAAESSITASVEGSYMDGNALSNITIMGLATEPASTIVTLNGKNVAKGVYNAGSRTFFIGDLDSATSLGAWANDWTLEYGAESGGYDLRGVAIPESWV